MSKSQYAFEMYAPKSFRYSRNLLGHMKMRDNGQKLWFWMLNRPTLDSLWFAKYNREWTLRMRREIKAR